MKQLLFVAVPFALLSAQEVTQNVIIHTRQGTASTASAAGAQPQGIKMEAEARHMASRAGTVQFISTEMGSSAAVKGSPYSAEAVTETVQTLADGNRITRKNSVTQYRDSEGRTRREFELQSIGRLGAVEAGAQKLITIDDPVAKMHYSLDLKNKTAMKMARGEGMFSIALPAPPPPPPPPFPPGTAGGVFAAATSPGQVMVARTMERGVNGPAEFTFATSSINTASTAGKDAKMEDLGTRNIEGVEAKGTRTTLTIPAGEEGNERDLNMVVEKWYSEQLKTFVMTRHSDPRMGETTLRLTNVRLGEPPSTLFSVPADFTVEEAPAAMQMIRKRIDEKRQE